jgi:hypothetical protein
LFHARIWHTLGWRSLAHAWVKTSNTTQLIHTLSRDVRRISSLMFLHFGLMPLPHIHPALNLSDN